jgi:hypothetical protein
MSRQRMSSAFACGLVLLQAVTGCGGGAPTDAGPDAGRADAGAVAAPDIPWLDDGVPPIAAPVLTPCPAGWREVPTDGITTCDPYPADGPAPCPAGQAHFPGEPGCAPIGRACPAGDFAEGLPDDGTVRFVLAGASGGDGSRAAPFGRIADALAVATAGTTVALGRGRYPEVVTLRSGVTLAGACPEATVITFRGADPRLAVVNATSSGVTMRDLSIDDSDRVGISVAGPSADLLLEGVVVRAATANGILADDSGRLRASGLRVHDTRAAADGESGRALLVQLGATADVTRALFEGNRGGGVFAQHEDTTLSLADVVVRDTQSRERDLGSGRGLGVELGARAEVTRALFERNREVSVFAEDEGTELSLTDVVVRDTEGRERDGGAGRGLGVELGASVQVSRALFERNRELAIFARDGAVLSGSDVVVRDTRGRASDGGLGRGLGAEAGASAEMTRATFERNRDVGVFAQDGGTVLTLTDVSVRDTQPQESDSAFGRGVAVQLGALGHVTRALLERNRDLGVYVVNAGTLLVLADVVVRDTQSQMSDSSFGRGLALQLGAGVEVTRAIFERNRDVGIFATDEGTMLTLTDAVVRDTRSQEADGAFGRGIELQLAARAEVGRVLVEASHDTGVYAHGQGTVMSLQDVVVRDTALTTCAETTCPQAASGHDVTTLDRAVVSVTRFVVSGAAQCGLMLAEEGQVDLSSGEVAGCPIGICLQVPGYPRARLTNGVVFRDVGRDIEGTAFAVPMPSDPAALTP